jgi:GABA(A) receptor-associated protein
MLVYIMISYKKRIPFETRKAESTRMLEKYKDKIPIVVEKNYKLAINPDIDKSKYLVPYDLSFGEFLQVIRKRTKIDPNQALFAFIDNKLPCTNDIMINIYKNHADDDGFLYIIYSMENTFG